jgi:cytochrome bd-type quinol oxidase subunit 2
MLHPLLHLITQRPELLADHAQAYAELAAEEWLAVRSTWLRRLLLMAAALCGCGVAAVLAGVALMLWASTPAAELHAPWALLAAPMLPLAFALCCLLLARLQPGATGFASLREQLLADLAMLREAAT